MPRAKKIEKGIVALLEARQGKPLGLGEAADYLVEEFGLDLVLKGAGVSSAWYLECLKARNNLVVRGVINQFPIETLSLATREGTNANRT